MYLGIDIGGTKTLLGCFNESGVLEEQIRFPTPKEYSAFLEALQFNVEKLSHDRTFRAAAAGIPGILDREQGVAVAFGNLPWVNIPIRTDIEKITGCPVIIENDAKLAGLSEALLVKDTYERVLYVTISTGIGIALINKGVIDTNFGDGGGSTILLEHEDKVVPWESFASGKAIVTQYGQRASEITDESIWQQITENLAIGFIDLIGLTQPDVVVVGGGVGTHFEKYHDLLVAALKKYERPQAPIPPLLEAKRPEQAVLYGCYAVSQTIQPQ